LISTTLVPASPVGKRLVFPFNFCASAQSNEKESEVARLAARLKSSDEEERYDSVIHLGSIRTQASANALKLALNDASEKVRQAALEGLNGMRDTQLIPVFTERLTNDKSIFVRKTAAYALGNLQSPLATPSLVAALKDKEQEVRSAAIVAIGQYRDTSAIRPLINSLADKADFVRAYAAYALGINGKDATEAVPAIVRLFTSDDDLEVRRQAAHALGRIGDRSALPHLERARHSSDPYLRIAVIEAIKLIESPR
jgi:HEAT repeat protein